MGVKGFQKYPEWEIRNKTKCLPLGNCCNRKFIFLLMPKVYEDFGLIFSSIQTDICQYMCMCPLRSMKAKSNWNMKTGL